MHRHTTPQYTLATPSLIDSGLGDVMVTVCMVQLPALADPTSHKGARSLPLEVYCSGNRHGDLSLHKSVIITATVSLEGAAKRGPLSW